MRGLLFATATLCATMPLAGKARASTNVASRFDRTIVKEPSYQSTPKYSLMTLGEENVKVWMVEDGRRLFVDKNANGDLTDDGPPIQPNNVRHLDARRWDFEYTLDAITPANGPQHSNFVLRRWNYNDKEDNYGLSISVGGKIPMYAGWFDTFWSTNRENAPIIHFGGPFTPKLLRRKEFVIGETGQQLSLCFIHPGSDPGAVSRLSIDALPRFVIPSLAIEWPTAAGKPPLRARHQLSQRCCYWEFYTTEFEVPHGVVVGKAKITVQMVPGVTAIELTTTEISAEVAAKSSEPDSER